MTQAYVDILGTDYLADAPDDINSTNDALRTDFAGPTAPASPVAYQRWIDTANGYLKQRNADNDAWIVIGVLGQNYLGLLPLSGGTMTGPIDMGAQQITNLAQGTGSAAARVTELDLKAPIAAPALTGDATVNQDPAGNNSLIRRSWAEARYLKLAGGTLTGALTLAGNGSAALHPISLQQLKTFLDFDLSTGHRHDGSTSGRKVRGVSLNSDAETAGKIMVANGSGAVTWSALPTLGWVFEDGMTQIGSRTVGASWQTLDISAYVPSSCVAVMVRLYVSIDVGGSGFVALRKYGTTPATAQTWTVNEDSFNQWFTVIPVSSQKFDWQADISGNLSSLYCYLIAYAQQL